MIYKKGLVFGVFDIFHIGHLKYIQFASKRCDHLYVGIRGDDLITPGKNRKTYFSQDIRLEIVSSLKHVQNAFIFHVALEDKKYWVSWMKDNDIDVVFVGIDWRGSSRWESLEPLLSDVNIKICYVNRTEGISSSGILNAANN